MASGVVMGFPLSGKITQKLGNFLAAAAAWLAKKLGNIGLNQCKQLRDLNFGLRVKPPPVYHTRWRLHTVPLIAERQAGKL